MFPPSRAAALAALLPLVALAAPSATAPPRDVTEAIHMALDDEYKARATYRAVMARYGRVLPFVNIERAEGRHIDALVALLRSRGLAVPADPYAAGVPPPRSLLAAAKAGVRAEVENAALYDQLLNAAHGDPEVTAIFEDLQAASIERHKRAFERAVARGGAPGRGSGGGGRGRGPGQGRGRRWRGGR